MDERFSKTEYVVEATSAERYFLQSKYKDEYSWENESTGLSLTVGELQHGLFGKKRPVVISCYWSKINDLYVLFWEATSQLVDYEMIRHWFELNCYPYDIEYPDTAAKTDVTNFSNCLYYSKHRKEILKNVEKVSNNPLIITNNIPR